MGVSLRETTCGGSSSASTDSSEHRDEDAYREFLAAGPDLCRDLTYQIHVLARAMMAKSQHITRATRVLTFGQMPLVVSLGLLKAFLVMTKGS